MTLSFDQLAATMAHSLWQGATLAAAALGGLWILPARRARLRYGVVLGAMAAVLFASLVTYAWLQQVPERPETGVGVVLGAPGPVATAPESGSAAVGGATNLDEMMPVAVRPGTRTWSELVGMGWLAGVAVMLLRTAVAHWRAEQLIRRAVRLENSQVHALVKELAQRLGIRRGIEVLGMAGAAVPATAGMLFPALLLPLELIGEMPAGQLRIIVAHELAHIRRYDSLVHFLQQVIEALMFFNPAVWWLSRQVRIEREACCDLLAVQCAGAPLEAAQTLARFAEMRWSALAGLGIAGPEGSLLGRIRRILHPGRRVGVAVPWYSGLMLLVLAGVLLLGMQRTAELTVRAAAELMTPAARVEKIAEIQKTSGLVPGAHAGEKIVFSGRVHTADGKAPGPDTRLYLQTQEGIGSVFSNAPLTPEGTFNVTLPWSPVRYTLVGKEHAPIVGGPLMPDAEGKIMPLDLVVTPGYRAQVRLVDEAGKALPGVEIQVQDNVYAYAFDRRKTLTDAEGLITIAHASPDLEIWMSAEAHGFQMDSTKMTLKAAEVAEWKLKQARPTTGVVRDATTGGPIAGAKVSLMSREQRIGGGAAVSDLTNLPVTATADEQGHFVLDTLSDDAVYKFIIDGAGHGSVMVPGIEAGQTRTIELGPERVVRVRLTGDLSRLKTKVRADGGTEAELHYMERIQTAASSSYSFDVPVTAVIEKGEAALEIRNRIGTLELQLPGKGVKLPAEGNVTFDLAGAEFQAGPVRRVTVICDTPAGVPAPDGMLQFYEIHDGEAGTMRNKKVVLQQGRGSVELSTPASLQIWDYNVPGYWLERPSSSLLQVDRGTTPQEIHLKAVPAGLVRGRALEADGKAFGAEYWMDSVTIKESPAMGDLRVSNASKYGEKGSAEVLLSELPLGGTYQLVARSEARMALSEPFELTEKSPIQTVDLRFVKGVRATGRIVTAAGAGVGHAAFMLQWKGPRGQGQTARAETDAEANFTLEGVNADLPGSYQIIVPETVDYLETKVTLNPMNSLEVRLQPGLELHGTVVDAATGKPLAHAKVRANYGLPATTDDAGRFAIRNLKAGEYLLNVEDAAPEGGRVESGGGWGATVHYPPGYVQPKYRAGDPREVNLRVVTR